MTGTAIDTQAAVEVAKSAAGILPQEGKTEVLDHLVSTMTREALKALSPEAREKLLQALTGTEVAPSDTQAQAVSKIKTIDGHQAVVGQILVEGQLLDTLLTEGSFNKTRKDQTAYATKLGYRLAAREEHLAYVKDLIEKEENNTINDAEKNALETYRRRYVRDIEGGLDVDVDDVDGRRVRDGGHRWRDSGYPNCGALFVRASAESK
jgi:hypothetical protein